ncbi:MAG TPA: cyclase family protein [bacterium]|nr:cyclase family protein [bacterium]
MALYDLTLPMRPDQPPWPGDPPFSKTPLSSTRQGQSANVSWLSLSSHFGTHLDAPFHFVDDGLRLDQIPPEVFVGPVRVHAVDTPDLIRLEHLPPLEGVERIVFKTRNTRFIADTVFHSDYVSLSLDAARALAAAGVKLVGIDYFSVEAYKNPGHPVHHALCGRGVVIVEGLDLRRIEPGDYEIIALPLLIEDGDGSPCRVLLRDLA